MASQAKSGCVGKRWRAKGVLARVCLRVSDSERRRRTSRTTAEIASVAAVPTSALWSACQRFVRQVCRDK